MYLNKSRSRQKSGALATLTSCLFQSGIPTYLPNIDLNFNVITSSFFVYENVISLERSSCVSEQTIITRHPLEVTGQILGVAGVGCK